MIAAEAAYHAQSTKVVDLPQSQSSSTKNVKESSPVDDESKDAHETTSNVKKVKIFIKTYVGKLIPLVVEEEETISSVKNKIAVKEEMSMESQKLMLGSTELMNFGHVSDYKLQTDSILHLVLKNPSPSTSPNNNCEKIVNIASGDQESPETVSVENEEIVDESSKEVDNGLVGHRFQLNDIVEGRYLDGHKWYRGKVTHVHGDGRIDIHYDDGDTEENVEADRTRPPTKCEDGSPRTSPRASPKVKAFHSINYISYVSIISFYINCVSLLAGEIAD